MCPLGKSGPDGIANCNSFHRKKLDYICKYNYLLYEKFNYDYIAITENNCNELHFN